VARLIDTSVFIALERRQINRDLLACSFPDEPIALTAITAVELLAGVYYADTEARRPRRPLLDRHVSGRRLQKWRKEGSR
jgi:predicted nucleic acid-binding protein